MNIDIDIDTDLIREAITEHYGRRCPDYEPSCVICAVWAQYDALTQDKEET